MAKKIKIGKPRTCPKCNKREFQDYWAWHSNRKTFWSWCANCGYSRGYKTIYNKKR